MFCHIDKIKANVDDLLRFRRGNGINDPPYVVYEATTVSWHPDNFSRCLEVVSSVDVFSPNHLELLALCGWPEKDFNKELIEGLAGKFIVAGVGPTSEGIVVVRAAQHGCLVMSKEIPATWLPAYYPPGHSKVVETTGAGNSFLGGFIMGLSETGNPVTAAKYGAVAASFVVEQLSLPSLDKAAATEADSELWNGEDPRERLIEYQSRFEAK